MRWIVSGTVKYADGREEVIKETWEDLTEEEAREHLDGVIDDFTLDRGGERVSIAASSQADDGEVKTIAQAAQKERKS